MSADILLARLGNVRSTGHLSWRADCPNGHQRARGSLSITQASDGCVLLHCFACGDTSGILGAVRMEIRDLFPARIEHQSPEARQQAREIFKRDGWAAALRVLSREACVVNAAAGWLRQRKELAEDDYNRLVLACSRIDRAREVLA